MSTPLSTIEFYKVPALSDNYRDSYYFNDATAQYNFFHGTTGAKTLSNSQYTRISNNQVKVPYPHSEMIEYNYMCIQNARGSDSSNSNTGKRFYCFITNCEYVSDMCTLITFKVDVIQTFIVGATLGESFVERCHADSDYKYQHREPEPFNVENYTVDKRVVEEIECYAVLGIVGGTKITTTASAESSHTPDYTTAPHWYMGGKVYSGSQFFIFDLTNTGDMTVLQRILVNEDILSHPDAITDFYIVPKSCYDHTTIGNILAVDATGDDKFHTVDILPSLSTPLSGYTPKNKKLYNYPYCKILVSSCTGDTVELLGEEFKFAYPLQDNTQVSFLERGNWYGGGEAVLQPVDYSINIDNTPNLNTIVGIKDFPLCSWHGDTYAMWKGQKLDAQMVNTAISASGNVISGALMMGINPVVGSLSLARTVGTTISDVGQTISDGIEADKKSNILYNKNTSAQLTMNYDYFGWIFERWTLSKAEAEQIDNFFTMFGYALNKIINVRNYLNGSARPKFCYIKTKGFSVKGNIPSVYKNEFNEVFNNGITFWKTDATVGDYSNNELS